MHNLEITGYKTIQYASCIGELTADEFAYFILLYVKQQNNEITITDFRRLLAYKLLGLKKTVKYYRMSETDRETIHDNLNRIIDTLDSFYEYTEEDNSLVKLLTMNWIQQMMPTIGNLVGPDHALTNCSIFEYKEAYTQYNSFLKYRDEESLNRLVAILYRPRKLLYSIRKRIAWNHIDERQSFTIRTNGLKLSRRVEKVKQLPAHIKTAVFIWFENCVQYIMTGRPTIDGIEMDFSILFSKSSNETEQSGIGLTGIIYSLAESSVFGNSDQTSNTNLYDVLARLYQLKSDYDAMTAKNKKNDNH